MALNTIDAKMLANMFLAGAQNLDAKKEWINELNVFPVPDGDTGTNMSMTIMAAANEIYKLENPDMPELLKAISSGSLRGARGNSGVILSQLFRGFCNVAKNNEKIDIETLAYAIEKASDTAYKAVMKPKEGTILTVAKGAAIKAKELIENGEEDMSVFIGEVIKHAEYVLSQTPEMLPVLKEAGVVDSGGQGLLEILKGAYDIFQGKELDLTIEKFTVSSPKLYIDTMELEEIVFGYCTEFIILLNRDFSTKKEMEFKKYLETIGDSIVVVADDELVKVHVHTNDPGMAIQRALKYGQLSNLKIDNMRLEHEEKLFKQSTVRKPFGFVAIASGSGLEEIFTGLGADRIISGGQTMNPSTEDIISAIDKISADTIFVLPNNKNIILAANQASTLVEDKKIIVIPTQTVTQGITAIINFVPELPAKENEEMMLEEIKKIKTGQVTYAVRDTTIDQQVITQDDFMGIGDHGILAVDSELLNCTVNMISKMMTDEIELISIYYGEEIKEEEANILVNILEKEYPNCDIELQYGGQPIYYYIVSVE